MASPRLKLLYIMKILLKKTDENHALSINERETKTISPQSKFSLQIEC